MCDHGEIYEFGTLECYLHVHAVAKVVPFEMGGWLEFDF